jgi:hypothetical protein
LTGGGTIVKKRIGKYLLVALVVVAGGVSTVDACVPYYTRDGGPGDTLGCRLYDVTSEGYCMYACKVIRSVRMV